MTPHRDKTEEEKKKTCRQSADADMSTVVEETRDPKGKSPMPFITNDQPQGRTPVEKVDRDRASRLHKMVTGAGKLAGRRVSISSWARQLATLRNELGGTPEADARIEAVLGWYASSVGKPLVPQAWCGETFRKKFDRLEACVKRARGEGQGVVASDQANAIAAKLKELRWPKGSDKFLPAAVELSLQSFNELDAKLKLLHNQLVRGEVPGYKPTGPRGRSSKVTDLLCLIDKIRLGEMRFPHTFVERWFREVLDRARFAEQMHAGTGGWKGGPLRHVFDWKSDKFRDRCRGWARELGNETLWDKLEVLLT